MVGVEKLGSDLKEIKLTLDSMQKIQEEFISLPAAAEYLHISKSRLYKATMQRTINFYKPTKKILFKKSDLVKFIEAGQVKSLNAA